MSNAGCEVSSYSVTVYMAGDLADIKRALRAECFAVGLCVTVTPTTFIYTGGEESGASIGIVNYPRFPSTPDAIWSQAVALAERLIVACCQRTALVVGADRTRWVAIEPPGARS